MAATQRPSCRRIWELTAKKLQLRVAVIRRRGKGSLNSTAFFGLLRTDFFQSSASSRSHPYACWFCCKALMCHSHLMLSKQESSCILCWLQFPHDLKGYPDAKCFISNYLACREGCTVLLREGAGRSITVITLSGYSEAEQSLIFTSGIHNS